MNFLKKLYSYQALDAFMLIFPIYMVMFSDLGLSSTQIASLLIINSVATLVLELPSGVLADKISRKTVIILGQLAKTLGFAIWIFSPTYVGFAIGMVLWGVRSALNSGTFSAFVYDELKYRNQHKKFVKVYGKATSIRGVSSILAAFAASAGVLLGYNFILGISILFSVLGCVILFSMKEVPLSENISQSWTIFKEGIKFAIKKHFLKLILFVSTVMTIRDGIASFWPLFFKDISLPLVAIGSAIGLISLAEAGGEFFAYRFEHLKRSSLSKILIVCGFLFLVATMLFNFVSIPIILIYTFIYTIVVSIFEGDVQHKIPTKVRATVSSINELLSEGSQIFVYFFFGLFSTVFSDQAGFYFFAIFIVLLGVSYFLLFRKCQNIEITN